MLEVVDDYGDRYIGHIYTMLPTPCHNGSIYVYYYGETSGKFIWRRYYYGDELSRKWEAGSPAERYDKSFLPDNLVRDQPPAVSLKYSMRLR